MFGFDPHGVLPAQLVRVTIAAGELVGLLLRKRKMYRIVQTCSQYRHFVSYGNAASGSALFQICPSSISAGIFCDAVVAVLHIDGHF